MTAVDALKRQAVAARLQLLGSLIARIAPRGTSFMLLGAALTAKAADGGRKDEVSELK